MQFLLPIVLLVSVSQAVNLTPSHRKNEGCADPAQDINTNFNEVKNINTPVDCAFIKISTLISMRPPKTSIRPRTVFSTQTRKGV